MDLATMSNAERWQEIAEAMTFEATVETAATGTAEVVTAVTIEAAAEPEVIEGPRVPRVVSITELRQKLGIVETPLARSAPLPMTGRPRIVRRRDAEACPELAAG